ncbi:uncharacterized protein C7orf50 homolog isoform X5 [Myotis lucifugus]|uniref:uncharacterized protein C7orf50 homolog isoform X5 n=1 Tax=Myotis lucifugus TaxID=59463 RepID=UPI0006D704A4|nr:uncharacterized protein C7orf50 homolog isoform X5 [Myotis lucifugus]
MWLRWKEADLNFSRKAVAWLGPAVQQPLLPEAWRLRDLCLRSSTPGWTVRGAAGPTLPRLLERAESASSEAELSPEEKRVLERKLKKERKKEERKRLREAAAAAPAPGQPLPAKPSGAQLALDYLCG